MAQPLMAFTLGSEIDDADEHVGGLLALPSLDEVVNDPHRLTIRIVDEVAAMPAVLSAPALVPRPLAKAEPSVRAGRGVVRPRPLRQRRFRPSPSPPADHPHHADDGQRRRSSGQRRHQRRGGGRHLQITSLPPREFNLAAPPELQVLNRSNRLAIEPMTPSRGDTAMPA